MNNQILNIKKLLAVPAIITVVVLSLSAETITFTADSMSGKSAENDDMTRLEGNALVTTETMEIEGDIIEISGKNYRFIHAEGNISGKNTKTKMEFTCDSLDYDKQTKTVVLQNNVTMTDTENNVKAFAQKIEYNQDTDVAVLQIDVKLEQKKNICTCAYAIYRKKAQMLDMSGNPVVQKDKDKFSAQTISFNLNTEDITMDGRVSGSIESNKDNESSDTDKSDETADSSEETNSTETTASAESTDSTVTTDSTAETNSSAADSTVEKDSSEETDSSATTKGEAQNNE